VLAARGWDGERPVLALFNMVAGTAVCLLLGGAWLAANIGLERAVLNGVLPFLLGGVIKSVVGALVLVLVTRVKR